MQFAIVIHNSIRFLFELTSYLNKTTLPLDTNNKEQVKNIKTLCLL